jgi:hypothetical protein
MQILGGMAMIQAWALEQEKGSRRNFNGQDVLVPWKLQKKFAEEKSVSTKDKETPSDISNSSQNSKVQDTGMFC